MDQSNFETSDILSFDYAVDDELKDIEQEDENVKKKENHIGNMNDNSKSEERTKDEKTKNNKNETNNHNNESSTKSSSKSSSSEKSSSNSSEKISGKSKNSLERKESSTKSKSSSVSTSNNSSSNKKPPKYSDKSDEASKNNDGPETSVKIYVSGITEETKASDLQKLFLKYGKVIDAKIIRFSKIPNECFGMVTVEDDQQAKKCIQNLNKNKLNGSVITLSKQSPLKIRNVSTNTTSSNHLKKNDKDLKNNDTKEAKLGQKIEKKKSNSNGKYNDKMDDKSKNKENSKNSKDEVDANREINKKDGSSKTLKENDKKDIGEKRVREKSPERRSRHRSSYKPNRPIPLSREFIKKQERLNRLKELREREELERIRHERIRFQKEKERLQMERLRLEREKIEIIRLEREKIMKERDELARRRQAAEEQRKRNEYLPSKRYERESSRSPEVYRSKRSNSRSFIDSSRFDSRETRNNFKRNKYDSNIEYDNRRHNSNNHDRDRDDRKELRRDSREHRFAEDVRRDRFTSEKDNSNININSPRPFSVTDSQRSTWTTPVASSQWTASNERWVPTFEAPHPVTTSLSPSIVPNNVNSLNDIYSANYSALSLPGISYSIHNRRF